MVAGEKHAGLRQRPEMGRGLLTDEIGAHAIPDDHDHAVGGGGHGGGGHARFGPGGGRAQGRGHEQSNGEKDGGAAVARHGGKERS